MPEISLVANEKLVRIAYTSPPISHAMAQEFATTVKQYMQDTGLNAYVAHEQARMMYGFNSLDIYVASVVSVNNWGDDNVIAEDFTTVTVATANNTTIAADHIYNQQLAAVTQQFLNEFPVNQLPVPQGIPPAPIPNNPLVPEHVVNDELEEEREIYRERVLLALRYIKIAKNIWFRNWYSVPKADLDPDWESKTKFLDELLGSKKLESLLWDSPLTSLVEVDAYDEELLPDPIDPEDD